MEVLALLAVTAVMYKKYTLTNISSRKTVARRYAQIGEEIAYRYE